MSAALKFTQKRSLPLVVRPAYDPRSDGALCDECPCKNRPVVPPTPSANPTKGIIVGQEPTYEDERQQILFVGPSGKKVSAVLNKHQLDRNDFHITSAALCRPKNEDEQLEAMRCCAPRLHNELEQFEKNIPIIPLGSFALKSVLNKKVPITLGRGFVWRVNDREIMPTLHPNFVMRDSLQSTLFERDFRRIALRIQQGSITLDAPPHYDVPRTVFELNRMLNNLGKVVSCDIETTEEGPTVAKMLCVGFSDGIRTVVVPWNSSYKYALNRFFKKRKAIFHNGFAFDTIVLEKHGVIVPDVEDTLIAHHIFASHFPQRLDHLVSMYCDAEPWKIQFGKRVSDEKGRPKVPQDEASLFKYNALDCWLTILVWLRMQSDLNVWKGLYEADKDLARVCREMQMNGVQVDIARKDELSAAIVVKEARLLQEMKVLSGREDLVPSKTAQIRQILFEQFKAPILDRTPKGLPSTGKQTLNKFAEVRRQHTYGEFAAKLIEWRGCLKMRVTYLDNLEIEADGRVHCSWRSFGTPTGRLAARKPNLQNLKRQDKRYKNEPEQNIRSIYIPKPGHVFVGFDMSQVEMRIAAYLSNDPQFIANVESGDMHTMNARLIFGNVPELMDLNEAKNGLGKSKRDISKNVGFAVNYLATADTVYETLHSQGFHDVRYPTCVDMLNKLQKAFAQYYRFVEENVEKVRKTGYLQVGFMSGRIRWIGHAPEPSKVANGPIQGGAADCMNNILIRLWKRFKKEFGTVVKIVAQIHDAVLTECPPELADRVETIIKEETSRPVRIGVHTKVLPIDLKRGTRWSEAA